METAAQNLHVSLESGSEPSLRFSGIISLLLWLLEDLEESLPTRKTNPDLAASVAVRFLLQAGQLCPHGVNSRTAVLPALALLWWFLRPFRLAGGQMSTYPPPSGPSSGGGLVFLLLPVFS